MFIKIAVVLAVLAIAVAHPVDHASSYVSVHHNESPVYEHTTHNNDYYKEDDLKYTHHEEKYPHHHPKYEYKYGVEDHHTGDNKSLKESRDGDVVKGEYTVVQPDGRIRTVKYTADHHSGFNAEVIYSGHSTYPSEGKKVEIVQGAREYYH